VKIHLHQLRAINRRAERVLGFHLEDLASSQTLKKSDKKRESRFYATVQSPIFKGRASFS